MGSNKHKPGLSPATHSSETELDDIVAGLRLSREVTHKIRHRGHVRELPSRAALETIRDGLMAALFPSHYGCPDLTDETIDYFVGHTLARALATLTEQVRRDLLFLPPGQRTITVGLAALSAGRTTSIPVLMAGSFISAVPAIVVYLIFQRHLIKGLTLGMGK